MVRRRSTVRFRNGAPRGLHVSVGTIFTFGSDIPACMLEWSGLLPCPVRWVFLGWLFVRGSWVPGVLPPAAVAGPGVRVPRGLARAVVPRMRRCLWRRGGQGGERLAASAAGFPGQAPGGAAGALFLAGGPGCPVGLVV